MVKILSPRFRDYTNASRASAPGSSTPPRSANRKGSGPIIPPILEASTSATVIGPVPASSSFPRSSHKAVSGRGAEIAESWRHFQPSAPPAPLREISSSRNEPRISRIPRIKPAPSFSHPCPSVKSVVKFLIAAGSTDTLPPERLPILLACSGSVRVRSTRGKAYSTCHGCAPPTIGRAKQCSMAMHIRPNVGAPSN